MSRRTELVDRPRLRVTAWTGDRGGMGRFGGGWQWALGIQAGRQSVIVNLIALQVRIDIGRRP